MAENGSVAFLRRFYVELFRGGMNRLLLRAMPTDQNPERIEVLFQYAHRIDVPMDFEGLSIVDATEEDRLLAPWSDVLVQHPDSRIYQLLSQGRIVGRVAAAACAYGEDHEPANAPSMFFMMK